MNNELQTFDFEGSPIRTVSIDGEPWFVGKDVAEVLGYAKPLNALATHIDQDDSLKQGVIDKLGRQQDTIIINESGMYSLVLSSKLESAKRFKRWVTSEVLPQIRKHGMYATAELLNNPDLAIQAFTALKAEREKVQALSLTNAIQAQQIAELQPKASYYDVILNCKDLISISKIAKDYGKSGRWLNEELHRRHIQYKQGKQWLLYQEYAPYGYTSTKTHDVTGSDGKQHAKVSTYWTQKGRLFIYDELKKDGIVPLIEREETSA